jgi:hypothetical protein
MKKITLIFILLFAFCFSAKAQFSVSYYQTNTISKIGLGYEFSDRIWSDVRMYGGLELEDFTIQPTILGNFVRKEKFDVYVGAGLTVGLLEGVNIPLGVRFRPLDNHRNILIHLEAEPLFQFENDGNIFFASFGLRYVFSKNREE